MDGVQLEAVTTDPPSNVEHPRLYEVAAGLLGLIGVLAIVGIVLLSVMGKQVDAGLAALGGIAIGALAALMSTERPA